MNSNAIRPNFSSVPGYSNIIHSESLFSIFLSILSRNFLSSRRSNYITLYLFQPHFSRSPSPYKCFILFLLSARLVWYSILLRVGIFFLFLTLLVALVLRVCELDAFFVTEVTHGWIESPAEEESSRVEEDSGLNIEVVPVIIRAYGVLGGLRTGIVEETVEPKLESRS